MRSSLVKFLTVASLSIVAATPSLAQHAHHQMPAPSKAAASNPTETLLAAVRAVHGGVGPWAVAGYRIGQRALKELGLPAHSFDLQVRHSSPAEFQYSCIADGLQAATGASQGKMNLKMITVPAAALMTEVVDQRSGRRLGFHLQDAFIAQVKDLKDSELEAAGTRVASMADDAIFKMEELPRTAPAPKS